MIPSLNDEKWKVLKCSGCGKEQRVGKQTPKIFCSDCFGEAREWVKHINDKKIKGNTRI